MARNIAGPPQFSNSYLRGYVEMPVDIYRPDYYYQDIHNRKGWVTMEQNRATEIMEQGYV